MMINSEKIEKVKSKYKSFIELCQDDEGYKLTPKSEVSPYALCFAIFGYHLIKDKKKIDENKEKWINQLISNINIYKKNIANEDIFFSKPYLQLLTFTLSSLKILNSIESSEMAKHVEPMMKLDIQKLLTKSGAAIGKPGSGNMTMFWAILLIHSRDVLDLNSNKKINQWIEFHIANMNKFGFWGNAKHMNYLMFQNGYHQYEIFDYLNIKGSFWNLAAKNIINLKDNNYRFAPYPGGGGCYDYDAIHILTSDQNIENYIDSVTRTADSIIKSQNDDGGFCESHFIRPRNYKNIFKNLNHFYFSPNQNKFEVLKRIVSIQRPQHNKIHTHWTKYSRDWNESDLWDSWFRLLLIARCDVVHNSEKFLDWGFINYPGIGFHHIFHRNS